jgi:hypothetical protein
VLSDGTGYIPVIRTDSDVHMFKNVIHKTKNCLGKPLCLILHLIYCSKYQRLFMILASPSCPCKERAERHRTPSQP